jgi:hypothetical protein
MRGLALVLALCVTSAARADGVQPWEAGVTEQARAEATRLRDEGYALFAAERHLDAAGKFTAAIAVFPHPKLHLAAAQAYVQLARWREAAVHFEKALAYGEAGLGDEIARAKSGLAEALTHMGAVVVSSTQRGAEISVDGNVVLVAPGSAQVRVDPGRHVVVATRAMLASEPITLDVAAGASASSEPVIWVTESRWRWARWKPWTVIASGAAIAIAGVPMVLYSNRQRDRYDERLPMMCSMGCNPEPPALVSLRESAGRWRSLAIGAFITGGVVLGGGLAWVALNGKVERRYRAPDVAVAPWLDGRGVELALTW